MEDIYRCYRSNIRFTQGGRMRGLRNYNNFITKRGGYTKGFSTRYGNKKYQVPGDAIFQVDSARQYGRNTGGRTSGRAPANNNTNYQGRRYGGPVPSQFRFGSGGWPGNALDKIGPYDSYPLDHYTGKPHYPTSIPIHIDFGIKRKKVRPIGAGSTYSYTTLFSPKRISKAKQARMLNKGVPTQYAEYLISARTTAGVGMQNYYVHNWPNIAVMDDLIAGSTTANGPKTADLWLRRGNMSMMMTNNSNANAFIEIWEGYYRRSCQNPANVYWKQGLLDQGAVGPAGPPSYVGFPDLTYRMDPLKSRYFSQFCRVTDVTSVELGTGRSHCHNSKYYANFKWNNEIFQEYNAQGTGYLGGMTRFMIVIARGGPINESGSASSNVSTATVAIDMVFSTKYNFFYNTPSTTATFISNTLPAITTPETVNATTGTPTTNIVG